MSHLHVHCTFVGHAAVRSGTLRFAAAVFAVVVVCMPGRAAGGDGGPYPDASPFNLATTETNFEGALTLEDAERTNDFVTGTWMEQAAARVLYETVTDPESQLALGILYIMGKGVVDDKTKALHFFNRAVSRCQIWRRTSPLVLLVAAHICIVYHTTTHMHRLPHYHTTNYQTAKLLFTRPWMW